MESFSKLVRYIMQELVAFALIISFTFVVLPTEKLQLYKETIISIIQRTPEVKVEVNQLYETR